MSKVRIVLLASVLAVAGARGASAAPECPSAAIGPLEVTPADSATLVTLDAYVAVRYSAGYFSEANGAPSETITLDDAAGDPVSGTLQQHGDTLFFVPSAPLAASTRYLGIATGPDGDFEFEFRTGTETDRSRPSIIEGLDDPRLEIRPDDVEPSCEAPEGGVRVGVTVTRATDDGPAGSVAYHLYLTRAPNLDAPELVATARNFTSADTMTIAFILPLSKNGVAACVTLVVTDGVGRTSRWEEPVCFDPTEETRFLGLCTQSVAGHRARGPWLGGVAVVVAGLVVAGRRSRRRDPHRIR